MSKPTFKLVLAPNTKSDGTTCVYLRLTHKRKMKRLSTGIYLKPEDWNPKQQNVRGSVKNYRNLRLFFEKWKQKAQDAAIRLQTGELEINLANYVRLIQIGEENDDLITFMEEELAKNKGRWSIVSLRNNRSKLKTLKQFRNPINMHKINYVFLEEYKAWLEDEGGRAYNTIHSHLRFCRMMMNRAIKQGLTTNYPFRDFRMADPKANHKDFLNKEERDTLWDLLYNGMLPGYLHKTLHFFLIACYTGVRQGDWEQFPSKPIEGKMLRIAQSKKKGEIVRIPLSEKALKLVQDFPEHYTTMTNQKFNMYLKEIMQLAKINKHISTHCARHTFVIMCLNEAKIPIDVVAQFIDDKVKTLQKHYARYLDSYKQEEISKLDALD